MKKLLIVESPAKIKTINKFLGKDFKIMSTVGHVKDLPEKELGITMNGSFQLQYVPLKDKDKVLADIAKEGQKSDEIYLAPDPDREGEIIAWHVAEELKKVVNPSRIHRITFNEITKTAIEEALKHPTSIDEDKVKAQQARRVLDRWVGYEVSPILWKKITKGLSAGRVQSVALKLIVNREKEIKAFVPEEYWTIDATFGFGKEQFVASLAQINKKKPTISNKEQAEKIQQQIKAVKDYSVTSIKDTERQKNPNAPFMTSTLQQAAYNKLGFSVQKTMQLAQKLYEGIPLNDPQSPVALITYMRSDSLRIADSAVKQVRGYIQKAYGKEYIPAKSLVYSKDKAQDAHEAIRPIDVEITPDYVAKFLDKDLTKLYTLIWQRFVSCQMKSAVYAQRQVTIDGGNFTFKVTGSTLLFDGFLRVYNDADESDEKEQKVIIPAGLKEKSSLELEKVTPKQHFTQPPPRYTEASLVKELEKEGIGRPSTYASILKTIQARAYTSLDPKKRFVPTELGSTVVDMLDQHLPKIMNVKFTALMEEDLDKIAQGSMQRDVLLREFWDAFEKDLKAWQGENTKKQAEKTGITCPQCKQGELVIRFGKAGSFVGCSRFPECSFTSNFSRNEANEIVLEEQKAPELLDKKCSQCEKQLRTIQGRFGPFIACSGYPECKFIYQEKASFPCPLDSGDVIRRSWKGKVFWGCSNYPKCKFSISGDIEDKPCPKCKKPYLLKRVSKDGTIFLSCADKECGFTQEIRPE